MHPRRARPTAALCANDLLALGLRHGCVGVGLRVPDDLAIVGDDEIDFAAMVGKLVSTPERSWPGLQLGPFPQLRQSERIRLAGGRGAGVV